MRIRYISDLHLEFLKPNKIEKLIRKIPPTKCDEVCVLAGDIGNPYQKNYDVFMEYINKSFPKIFVIPGNHEYYLHKKTIQETNEYLVEYFQTKYPNIRLLNNQYEIYNGKYFVGTTLWSKITDPTFPINDVFCIKDFDYLKYNRLHRLAVDFLEDTLENHVVSGGEAAAVIITHHLPSNDLIDPKYRTSKMSPYNQWFSCDMNSFVDTHKGKIACWIYGHTHTPNQSLIHGIPFCCNPIGYPNENPKPDFEKYVEI